MKMTRILTVIIVAMTLIIVAGCGSSSPTTPSVGTVVVNGKTAFVNMAVNFPPRTTATGLISPLISINTTKVNITVFAAGTNQILGSSLIIAPASGGIASTSIPINGYAGPTYIDIKGYDNANALTGYIRQNNVTITAGVITNVSATMAEFNQGVTLTGYNLVSPDNTIYALNNIFLSPDPASDYALGVKLTNASNATVVYLFSNFNNLLEIASKTTPMISDGIASFPIELSNASGTQISKYNITISFASGANTPWVTVVPKGIYSKTSPYRPVPPTTNNLNGILWSGTQYLATGDNGTILTSPDASNWITRTSGTLNHLQTGTWANAQFVIPGASGTLLTSPDGITWTARTSGTVNNLFALTASGTQYVAVGGLGTILTSSDSITWALAPSPTTSDLYSVTTGTQYVAVGVTGTIVTSSGASWVTRASPYANTWTGVVYSSTLGRYAGVGLAGVNMNSLDSITWTGGTFLYTYNMQGVAWSGTQFVAVGDFGLIYTSPDGITWTLRANPIQFYGISLFDVTWTGTQFVVVGAGGMVMTSPDGINWTISPHPVPGAASFAGGIAWNNSIAPPPATMPVTVF